MKRYYFSIIIVLLTAGVLFPQWMWQNPRPHGITLWGVYFLNDKTGWACGLYGVIQKTTDGGLTYTYQQIDSVVQLTGVYFLNEMTGYISGCLGRLYRTTDGGNTYTMIRNASNEVIYRLVFTDNLNGWAWGGTANNSGFILHTSDGGNSWQTQYSNTYGEVTSLSFLNSSTGYGCLFPGGAIIKTTNGGINWIQICDSTMIAPNVVWFVNETTGVLGAYYTAEVMKTTNGGYNWYNIQNTFFQTYIDDIAFVNETTGFLSTGPTCRPDYSYILKTTDAGENWFVSLTSTEMGEFYPNIIVNNAPVIRAVGDFATSVVSYDLGNSWERENFVTYADLRRVIFLNSQTGWAWGDYVSSCDVLKTTNGGDNWSVKFNSANKVGSIYFLDLQNGYYTNSAGEIFRTTNGGDNWIKIYQLANNYLTDMHFINSQSGWVCGDSGRVLRTTNGGQSWEYQSVGYNYRMIRIKFFDENRGWALANYSKIFRTTNGGVNWNAINLSSNFYFYSMSFPSDSIGFVGAGAYIYKTTNQGINWTTYYLGVEQVYSSIYFLNPNTGFTYATGGHFFRTTNSGINWQHCLLNKYGSISSGDITFIDENTGWFAGGHGGIILKTTNGGTVFVNRIKESIPDDYKLYQNYPNPFNAVTNIKYSLPRDSYVRLEVYDILGRRIKVLVDEQQKAGTYQVTFFADDLSSGVYFYRLEINGKQIISRRMILVK